MNEMPNPTPVPSMNWKLFRILWLAGLPGIVAVAWLLVPATLAGQALPVPLWVVSLASAVQSALLLAVAVFAGTRLAPRVGLEAPLVQGFLDGRPLRGILAPRLLPALAGGLLGAAILWLFARLAPAGLADLQGQVAMPLAVRLLYGGVTEEILIRWGLMTWLAWLGWRYGGGGTGPLSPAATWLAIGASALLFGAGHLPAAAALLGQLDPTVAAYIVAGNAAFGMVAGYLYWRRGLEAAIIAHGLAHFGFVLAAG